MNQAFFPVCQNPQPVPRVDLPYSLASWSPFLEREREREGKTKWDGELAKPISPPSLITSPPGDSLIYADTNKTASRTTIVMGITTRALIRSWKPGEIKTSVTASHPQRPPTPVPQAALSLAGLSNPPVSELSCSTGFKQVALTKCGQMCLV